MQLRLLNVCTFNFAQRQKFPTWDFIDIYTILCKYYFNIYFEYAFTDKLFFIYNLQNFCVWG